MLSLALLLAVLSQSPSNQPIAGIVNGDTIFLDVYAREVGRKSELQSMAGTVSSADIMQQTWADMVMRELLRRQAQKYSVDVTTKQVDSVLLRSTPDFVRRGFVNEKGRFDVRLLEAMLYKPDSLVRARMPRASAADRAGSVASIQSSMEELRARVADMMRRERLRRYVTGTAVLDTAELRLRYNEWLFRATADVFYHPCSTVRFTPSEADAKAWYTANATRYTSNVEMRQLGIFIWPLTAAPFDSTLVIRDIRAFVAQMNGFHDWRRKDSLWNSVAEKVESARVRLSPDSAVQAEFYNTVRSTRGGKAGTCIGPMFHPIGIHVLLIDSVIVTGKGKTEYDVRVLLAPVEPSKQTADSILADVKAAAQMYANGSTPEQIAARYGKQLTVSPWVKPTDQLYESYRLVQAAFEVPIGSMTDPIDTPESGIMLVIPMDSVPAGKLPFEAARDMVIADMRREYACGHLEPRAKSMRAVTTRLPDGRMLIAEQIPGTSVWRDQQIDGSGFVGPEVYDPTASLIIRQSTQSGLVGPFRGDAGWYIVNIHQTSKLEGPPFHEWLQGEGDLYVQRMHETIWDQWLSDVRAQATVVDLRWVYFRY